MMSVLTKHGGSFISPCFFICFTSCYAIQCNCMKKILALVFTFSITVLLIPGLVYGASLIPCGQPSGTPNIIVNGVSVVTTNQCGFNDLLILFNTIVTFLMFTVAVPLAALRFMYAGVILVLNPSKEESRTKAVNIFQGVGVGFLVMLGAYVLIKGVIYSFLTAEQITFMQFMFQ